MKSALAAGCVLGSTVPGAATIGQGLTEPRQLTITPSVPALLTLVTMLAAMGCYYAIKSTIEVTHIINQFVSTLAETPPSSALIY